MKNFVVDEWEEFNKLANNKKVIMMCAPRAKEILREIEKYNISWDVYAIIDNDHNKHGEIVEYEKKKLMISGIDILEKCNKKEIIALICGSYITEIAEQLESIGIYDYYSEWWMNVPKVLRVYRKQEIRDEYKKRLIDMMSDEQSKKILKAIFKKRKEGILDYSDIKSRGKSEYFIDEFWKPDNNEVFIDGGGYDGDTIEEFYDWTKGLFKIIYSFEPELDKYNIICNKKWKYGDKLKVFNNGLWSSKEELCFKNGDKNWSGLITEEGNEIIKTVALDEVVNERVTFIKMDIEGAEKEAIKGAEKIIRSYTPKMAICIYHKPEDLWELPFLISEINNNYNFYVRHFGMRYFGTILYCVPKGKEI